MEKKKTHIWMQEHKHLKARNAKTEETQKEFLEKLRTVTAASEFVVKKSAVDYYSMKVPFNSI